MYILIHTLIHTCTYIHNMHTYVCVQAYMYVCVYLCMCVCTYICVYVYMYMHVYMYVYTSVRVYVYIWWPVQGTPAGLLDCIFP